MAGASVCLPCGRLTPRERQRARPAGRSDGSRPPGRGRWAHRARSRASRRRPGPRSPPPPGGRARGDHLDGAGPARVPAHRLRHQPPAHARAPAVCGGDEPVHVVRGRVGAEQQAADRAGGPGGGCGGLRGLGDQRRPGTDVGLHRPVEARLSTIGPNQCSTWAARARKPSRSPSRAGLIVIIRAVSQSRPAPGSGRGLRARTPLPGPPAPPGPGRPRGRRRRCGRRRSTAGCG